MEFNGVSQFWTLQKISESLSNFIKIDAINTDGLTVNTDKFYTYIRRTSDIGTINLSSINTNKETLSLFLNQDEISTIYQTVSLINFICYITNDYATVKKMGFVTYEFMPEETINQLMEGKKILKDLLKINQLGSKNFNIYFYNQEDKKYNIFIGLKFMKTTLKIDKLEDMYEVILNCFKSYLKKELEYSIDLNIDNIEETKNLLDMITI